MIPLPCNIVLRKEGRNAFESSMQAHNSPFHLIFFGQQDKWLLGLWVAPQQLHGNLTPPASRWTLPIACDALNARTVAVREYLAFCVSSPMRCQVHFAVRVGIAHFTEGHSVPAVRLGTEGMYLSAFMLRRSCLPGFLCQMPAAESGKGNTPCFWLLHR